METPNNQYSSRNRLRIGKNIKRIREAQALSAEFVASELGLDMGAYSRIETDESVVSEEQLQQLSKTLRVSMADLLSNQDPLHFLNYSTANEQSYSDLNRNGEIERLERLYQEQINLLRDEVSYLRNLLESVAKKG